MNSTQKFGMGAAILGGGLVFTGPALAGVLLTEDFEAASPGLWSNGFGTYATGANYSNDPHSSVPGGGALYGHLIGIGSDPGVLTSAQNTSQVFDFTGGDATIVANGGFLNFDGWLASYTANDDYAAFYVEFFDAAGATGASLGIADIADGSKDDGQVVSTPAGAWDQFNWSNYLTHVSVPTNAASVLFRYEGRATANNGNDAYTDNLTLSVDAVANGLNIPLGTAPNFITANFTGLAGGNNNASDDANWDSGPSTPWDTDTTVVIANGTTGGNPAVIDAALGSQSVRAINFGADGVTTDVVMATGSELIGVGVFDSVIGVENSTVNFTANGTARLNHAGAGEEISDLVLGNEGSTVTAVMNNSSQLTAGNFTIDSGYATGFRRPLTGDPDDRLGDDLAIGNGGDVNLTMNGGSLAFAPDVLAVNGTAVDVNADVVVVQNGTSKVVANWDVRLGNSSTTITDAATTSTTTWTLNDSSQFLAARDHGLGEAGNGGAVTVNINDNALLYAGGRIALGAGFTGTATINQTGGRLQAGSAIGSPGSGGDLTVDTTGADATDTVRDGLLWLGSNGTAVYNLSGGTADITRAAFIGAGGAGTGTVNQSGGTFTVYGTGSTGTADPNVFSGTFDITQWDDAGGDLFIGRVEGDNGTYNISGGQLSVARDIRIGFDSSDGTLVGGDGALNVSGTADVDVTSVLAVGGDGNGTLSVRGGSATVDTAFLTVGGVAGTESGTGTLKALITGASHTAINAPSGSFLQNNAALEAEIDVNYATYRPTNGTSFVLVNHGSVAGDAGTFNGITAREIDGIDWSFSVTGSQVTITADNVFAIGDTDFDGDIDDADFGKSFAGFTGPNATGGTFASGDMDNDGDVDDADFGLSFAAFTGPGGSPASVPEPASLTLLALGGLLATRRRRSL